MQLVTVGLAGGSRCVPVVIGDKSDRGGGPDFPSPDVSLTENTHNRLHSF